MSQTHELKCWPEYFEAMASGEKPFDLRRDDRGFEVGDMLVLREWVPETHYPRSGFSSGSIGARYTGRSLHCRVGYVLREFVGLTPGYVVLGVARMSSWEAASDED